MPFSTFVFGIKLKFCFIFELSELVISMSKAFIGLNSFLATIPNSFSSKETYVSSSTGELFPML